MEEIAAFSVGRSATLRRTVTAAEVEAFAALTGDSNPLHLDEAYAATTRFQHRIAHGMLAASYISALLGSQFPGPGTVYLSQSLTFSRPVYLGDSLDVRAVVKAFRSDKAILTLETSVKNQRGETVLSGEAVCLVADVARSLAGSGAAAG